MSHQLYRILAVLKISTGRFTILQTPKLHTTNFKSVNPVFFPEVENFTRDKLMSSMSIKTISLMPEESDRISVVMPLTQCDEGCYVGMYVEYMIGDSLEIAGKIWQITYNDEILLDSWVKK